MWGALPSCVPISVQVNVYRFVKRMRRSRPFMVRNLNQYRFIYECLFEEFQAGDTVLRLDMKQQYRALCQKNPQSDFTFLMDQFRILCHFTPELTQKDCTVGSLKTNASKNVDQRMLPPDRYRPYNQVTQGDPGSWPYINAVIFNGHRRAEEFIVTQTPLINTAFEFWKMIYDYQVQTIVMFGKCRGHNQEQYFPKTGGRQFGNLYVEHVNTTSADAVTTRNLKVCVMGPGGVEKRAIRHLKLSSTGQFQVKQWDDGDTLPVRRIDQFPNSMEDVLNLMEKVLDWQVVANRRTKPMVVVCRNGATLSGLFVACAVVCERMREDREVDLYHAVKHIKRRRPAIVSDFVSIKGYIVLKSGMKPDEAILEAADEEKVDHIFMGTRDLNSLERVFIGSVSTAVVRNAKVPVTIVKMDQGRSSIS
ncbi:hypothetical protein Btru_063268 [Bulinus truncatus]|nr:hypothetical protein Btru_063268 [Bulinus truncatus]